MKICYLDGCRECNGPCVRPRKGLLCLLLIGFVLFAAVLCPAPALAESNRATVLLVARDKSIDMEYFIKNEVNLMIDFLKAAGYEVRVATPSGKLIEAGATRLESNLKMSDVQVKDYVAVVVPCMGAADYSVPKECVAIVREAELKGIIVAAQHSTEVLAPAGLAKTYKIANSPGVVIDRHLITSYNCPYTAISNHQPVDTEKLIAALVTELSRK